MFAIGGEYTSSRSYVRNTWCNVRVIQRVPFLYSHSASEIVPKKKMASRDSNPCKKKSAKKKKKQVGYFADCEAGE
jgi:hypothetical protein